MSEPSIRCELSGDRERGPGHGVIAISGLRSHAAPLQLVLMRNQAIEPYLAPDGSWQGNETLLTVSVLETRGDTLSALAGPELVDAIVAQPASVAYRLTVVSDQGKVHGTLKVKHPLLGSLAAAPARPVAPEPAQEPPTPRNEAPEHPAAPKPPPTEPDPSPREPLAEQREEPPATQRPGNLVLVVVAVALLLLVAAGAYYAWRMCLFPDLGPGGCVEPVGPPPSIEPSTARGNSPIADNGLVRSCRGLAPADCIAAAEALRESDMELARELYQQAARMGSTQAMLQIGEMYDPDTWSSATSPEAAPDWETAAYWYESAAQRGILDGQVRAGRVLCRHGGNSLEIMRGVEFLAQAIAAGAAGDTPALLSNCRSRLP